MSTSEFQHRETSRAWQREVAEATIAGRGVIVQEFFDEGCSRRSAWPKRPAAAALLAAAGSSDRGFDAVIVGEYERAFCGNQFREVMSVLAEWDVGVWLPEADGPVDLADPEHRALMVLLGAQSRREVVRSRHRVLAAMRTQACVQGRFLGGRPPYGYRLMDAGPHPLKTHARWGRRLRQLEPDPVTGPWVQWIFQQRAAGRSIAGIARELNDRGVACPSGADPQRNRHCSGRAWGTPTVAGILENPRYTGRQVWNRAGTIKSRGRTRHVNAEEWAVSNTHAHAALVDEATFRSVQGVRAARRSQDGRTRTYLLAGLVICGRCERRFDSHWVHDRPGYRCRHGRTSARAEKPRLKSVYVREERLLDGLRSRFPEITGGDEDLVAYLRANRLVIVYCDADWTLEELQPEATAPAAPLGGAQLSLPVY